MAAQESLPFRVNMERIAEIESGKSPWKVSKKGAVGYYQITKVVLQEYNTFANVANPYSVKDLYNIEINERIADWYLHERIPAMLQAFGHRLTIDNVLVAYNAGIRYVGKRIPRETREYIKRYKEIRK